MPANPRVRTNNAQGTLTDSPLLVGALVMNSAGLANLAAVATQHAVITIDPLRSAGAPEYVIVTAHTGGATSATITRGAFGSSARQHAAGVLWVHAPVAEDFIAIVTSATRPADPYEGQGIYETDTNKLAFYTGSDWAYRDAGGTLGYAEVVANQTGIGAPADLTGLTVTVTVAAGRRIRISGATVAGIDTAVDQVSLRIKEGATQLAEAPNTLTTAGRGYRYDVSTVETPSAGAHTYKLTLGRDTGASTAITSYANSTTPAFLLVEDIGAA